MLVCAFPRGCCIAHRQASKALPGQEFRLNGGPPHPKPTLSIVSQARIFDTPLVASGGPGETPPPLFMEVDRPLTRRPLADLQDFENVVFVILRRQAKK